MDSSDRTDLPEADRPLTESQSDRLDYLEARLSTLEERIPKTQLLNRRFLPRAFAVLGHYLVAGLMIYVVALAAFLLIAALGFGAHGVPELFGEDASSEGPPLSNVASLPVDAAGTGTMRGAPTGEITTGDNDGSFVLILDPAPAGLPDRSTVSVAFDRSTKVYRGNDMLGDPLEALNSDDGYGDADPSSAGSVVVRFHIKDGQVFADRLDLSDELPSDSAP